MMARGSGIREGRNMDPDRPDQSGSVGQDSKGTYIGFLWDELAMEMAPAGLSYVSSRRWLPPSLGLG